MFVMAFAPVNVIAKVPFAPVVVKLPTTIPESPSSAGSKLVNLDVTRWYHCLSRCVRRAYLLGEGENVGQREDWIENRLRELDSIFAVSVGGFAILDNHLHLLLRVDRDVAKSWTDEEIVRRWFRLYLPKGSDRKPLKASELRQLKEDCLKDKPWLEKTLERLTSLNWFMKNLKDPLSRLINQ